MHLCTLVDGTCIYTVFGTRDELPVHYVTPKTVKWFTNCTQSPSGAPNTQHVQQPAPVIDCYWLRGRLENVL